MIYEPIPFKRCTKCGTVKPYTQAFFYRRKSGRIERQCKECSIANARKSAINNPDKTREKNRRWRLRHPEQKRESDRRHEKTEKAKRNHERWIRNNPIRAEESRKRKQKTYRSKHMDRLITRNQQRAARKRSLPATFTPQDWLNCLAYFGNRCAICGRPRGLWHTLAQDHWIPLSKGGAYVPDNIIPLCHGEGGCNNSKNDADPVEWLTRKFGKNAAKRKLSEIQAYFDSLKH